jgi:hypothetical protein
MAGLREPCYARSMLKWVLTLVVLGAIAAAGAWYPIHGRTVLSRWRAASGPMEFVQRGVSEIQAEFRGGRAPNAPQASKGPKQVRPKATTPARPGPAHPTESVTDADRAALDRLLADQTRR